MTEWLSSCVEKQAEVGDALTDLANKIREYEDAAKPSACRKRGGGRDPELGLFRPGWKLFAGISIGCGIAGGIFSLLVPGYGADKWADLALVVTVPVFVLGISLVSVARSMSMSGRFAVEYLNDSCRMQWFCCLTLVAVLAGFVGRFLCTIEYFPNVVTVGLCAASLGAAIDCLAMLAFVVCETIWCSIPSESIKVVTRYAARKLTYAYLKEVYSTLLWRQHKDYLEKWCAGKSIHPPSQYYGHYFRSNLHSGEVDNDVEIEMDRRISGQNMYKDYDLEGLAELNKHLKEDGAELYLSLPEYESEQRILGILSCKNVLQKGSLRGLVFKMGGEAVRLKKLIFAEEDEDFWDSQQSKLNEAVKRAVDRADPIQLRAYLDAVNTPLSVLRDVRSHKVVRDACGEYVRRGYDFLRLYLRALHEILARQESEPKHRAEDSYKLLSFLRNSVWEETKKILSDMDYHTMELFTWLVPQMYSVIPDAGDDVKALREMRAQFGGFYDFADGWLEENEEGKAEDVDKMRLVLHEGLTKWLLIAIERNDQELIEQLCDAARKIVYGREGVKFDHREAVLQHFVLAGHLIDRMKAKKVNAEAVERLFCERYSHEPSVDFNDLVRFYLDNSLPLKTLDSYRNIFYSPKQTHMNMLTGSSHSSGTGMMGSQEISWAFIFLAAHALKSSHQLHDPVIDMSGRINEENIKTIGEVFKGGGLDHGLSQLRDWIQTCEELHEVEEAKEIAEAKFNGEKVKEHVKKFWEGYSRSVPVLSLCLKNGNYEIDNDSLEEWRYVIPKIAVIDWKCPVIGAEGDNYGRSLGKDTERKMLINIVEKSDEESKVEGGFSDVIGEAVKWLMKEGCKGEEGIVISVSKRWPATELYRDDSFVPSWREDVRSLGFDGFYKGFPITRFREEDDKEKDTEKTNEPRRERVVAVDLRGWRGISVREEVVTERKFGKLEIREWSQDEIQQAIDSNKLDEKDVDKAKGNCPVDVSFYWKFSSDQLPRRMTFVARHGSIQKED